MASSRGVVRHCLVYADEWHGQGMARTESRLDVGMCKHLAQVTFRFSVHSHALGVCHNGTEARED